MHIHLMSNFGLYFAFFALNCQKKMAKKKSVVFHVTVTDVNNLVPRFPLNFLFSFGLLADS